ncbi:MAG: hypothetical protein KIS96_07055 [Bauldia sp.]|nr:hypothetical protein [Bauldia sp.]
MATTAHRFHPGQRVTLTVRPTLSDAARGVYLVVRQLPATGDDNQYRIKSEVERHERVVRESQLTAAARS